VTFPLTIDGSAGVYHKGVFSLDSFKSTKVFVLKCLFLCCIDLSHTAGPVLFLLVKIVAVTFFAKFLYSGTSLIWAVWYLLVLVPTTVHISEMSFLRNACCNAVVKCK